MWNGTMFVDLDLPLNVSSLLSASAELLVHFSIPGRILQSCIDNKTKNYYFIDMSCVDEAQGNGKL